MSRGYPGILGAQFDSVLGHVVFSERKTDNQ